MTPRTPPGQTRSQILQFVRSRIREGHPPTVREVQNEFGFKAVQTAQEHLATLVREGLLHKESGARGYRLPGSFDSPSNVLVPLLGRVQAGSLTEACEDPEGYLSLPSRFPAQELFALRVRGKSMTQAGILPGDVVIVRRQPTADSGDVVVAMVGKEATVKTLRKKKNRIELHPAHPDFEPIIPPAHELVLLGKVIELRRYFGAIPFTDWNGTSS